MSCSHREEQREGRLFDVLTDEETGLRLVVSRLGAELISLARRDENGEWIGFLHRDGDLTPPEKGWGNHATVMGFFLHRLKDQRSLYRGEPIEGGTHSFLRGKAWRAPQVETEEGRLTYTIEPADYTATEYPLAVALELSYAIEEEDVRVTFTFENQEPERAAHLGFGLHPGFAAANFESFGLDMPAGRYRRHFSPTNYLSGQTQDFDFSGGEMPFDREKLPGSFILELVNVPDRTFTFYDPPTSRSVTLELDGVPYLTLWSDGGAFLCVEPCWGLTDHDQQRPFEDKEGIQILAAGMQFEASFTMSPRLGAGAAS